LRDGGTALSLVKVGSGTMTLSGNNNAMSGTTTVREGALIINGNYASAVTVSNGATLGGQGTLTGEVTIDAGGTMSPGASVGTMTINNNLFLIGDLFIEVDKEDSQTNDYAVVTGALVNTGTGTLTLTNVNANPSYAYAAGDKFTLFSQALFNGEALTIVPATPGAGLAWTNKLADDGSIEVISTSGIATNPTNIVFNVSGGQITLSWPADHTGWTLEAQTNLLSTGLNGIWYPVAGSTATNEMTFNVDAANPTVFYRLVYP